MKTRQIQTSASPNVFFSSFSLSSLPSFLFTYISAWDLSARRYATVLTAQLWIEWLDDILKFNPLLHQKTLKQNSTWNIIEIRSTICCTVLTVAMHKILFWSYSVARSHRVAVECYPGAPYSLKSTVSETRRNCYRSLGLFWMVGIRLRPLLLLALSYLPLRRRISCSPAS